LIDEEFCILSIRCLLQKPGLMTCKITTSIKFNWLTTLLISSYWLLKNISIKKS